MQGTWTYTREYEHASVFVDLTNRTGRPAALISPAGV